MPHFIVHPIQLQFLKLNEGKTVTDSTADFSSLPWNNGERDLNAEFPYLGETVSAEAFQSQTLYLDPGIHLFWLLPRIFRTSIQDSDNNKQRFPLVPNRWLINKLDTAGKPIKQWVVESDYIADSLSRYNERAVNIPVHPGGHDQPYKFLGRQQSLVEWRSNLQGKRNPTYWKDVFDGDLTAMGYGEPSFSTLYPNCRSVFGCYDEDLACNGDYEVIGWYDDPMKDIINNSQTVEKQEAVANDYNWKLNVDWDKLEAPFDGVLFYGSVKIKEESISNPKVDHVSLAYTGSEALSSYVADTIESSLDKEQIEDTLEAILFGSKIQKGSIDSLPNFFEARHQKGFDGQDGGILWTVRNTDRKPEDIKVTPSAELAQLLNELNLAQNEYDHDINSLNGLYSQLYANWSKYIQACYPPLGEGFNFPNIDDIKAFIERGIEEDIRPLKEKIGDLIIHNKDDDYKVEVSPTSGPDSDAKKVADLFAKLAAKLNQEIPTWKLNAITSPRYYYPKDPVVLFIGNKAGFEYLNETGLPQVKCLVEKDLDIIGLIKKGAEIEKDSLSTILSIPDGDHEFENGIPVWEPQLFQWQVDYFPVTKGSNLQSDTNTYHSDFVEANFSLDENRFDFDMNLDGISNGYQYEGKTYLSGSVKSNFLDILKRFIGKENKQLDGEDFEEKIKKWQAEHPEERGKAIYIAIQAWLLVNEKFLISQSLGGFHQALLQQRHNLQLPIADPLGFHAYKEFTDKIAKELKGKYVMSPMPTEQFIPISAGGVRLKRVNFIDQFGCKLDLKELSHVISNNALSISEVNDIKWLPPRLSQATRLNLRWLSAWDDKVEVNSAMNTSPICGWVVANYLNHALVFYEGSGIQLGYFSMSGKWVPALGNSDPFTEQDIAESNPKSININLLAVLIFMKIQIGEVGELNPFLKAFMDELEVAQSNIFPETTAARDASALLMSRPIAMVRTTVGLEVMGNFKFDQSWNALASALNRNGKITTAEYEKVKFPIILGEHKQLSDGLVGYWLNEGNRIKDIFYSNTDGEDSKGIEHHHQLKKSLEDEPSILTVLMDPRSILHATTGILPVKTIQIPSEHYSEELRRIEIDFQVAPIITPSKEINISMPKQKEKLWEWYEKDESGGLNRSVPTHFNDNGSFYKQKIREGWMKLKKEKE